MNLDIYSDRAKQAIQSAQSLALARPKKITASHFEDLLLHGGGVSRLKTKLAMKCDLEIEREGGRDPG